MFNSLNLLLRRISFSRSGADSCTNGQHCYSGYYLNGKAVYYYNLSGDVRVYEGKFMFFRSYYDYPLGRTVEKAEGFFADDKKDGHWVFSQKNKKVHKRLDVDFSEGKQNGTYEYRSVCRSHILGVWSGDTHLSLSMRNGMPVGKIEASFDEDKFVGYIDEDGRPDGKWVYDMSRKKSCVVEYEIWSHGNLKEAYFIDMSTGVKGTSKISLVEFIMNFVYGECRPLENIVKRGSVTWDGNLKHKK